MELQTQQSAGKTFPHLLFPVNHKISASALICVCAYRNKLRETQFPSAKSRNNTKLSDTITFQVLHLYHQQMSHVGSQRSNLMASY